MKQTNKTNKTQANNKRGKTVSKVLNKQETFSLFTDYDIYLFKEGNHFKLHEKLGSHIVKQGRTSGVYFAVYAPNANYVSLICDSNGWHSGKHPMKLRTDDSGIWEVWIKGLKEGEKYKYHISNKHTKGIYEKIDPFARYFEAPPKTASIVYDANKYKWEDSKWKKQDNIKGLEKPISVYEVHIGSWKRKFSADKDEGDFLTYRDLADQLIPYVKKLGFTHIELLPITEHPYYLSWGYQSLGFFAPTSRYGTPEEFKYFVDMCHQNQIGVILDFVPSHFPCDPHGLYEFDGGNVFEYPDEFKKIHPDWGSAVFNFNSPFVINFLISSALFFLKEYHVDGFRIDAVASMLYLDYSREDGNWQPNIYGGRENLEAIRFLQKLNEAVFLNFPSSHMIAEESTAWGGVSRPVHYGGLGFDMKWMMGWMHDVLNYFKKEPIYRKHHHHELTFSYLYFNTENFMLPLSHDEVVHGKGSLMDRMPGDYWQKFANLRLLFSYQFLHPGAKLLFMGSEFGQFNQWNVNQSLDWNLLEFENHKKMTQLVSALNKLYRTEPALYEGQFTTDKILWLEINDNQQSILSFARQSNKGEHLLIVGNFTPVVRNQFRIGAIEKGKYQEIFNSDHEEFGGSHVVNTTTTTEKKHYHRQEYSLLLNLPPLAFIVLKKNKNAK